MNTINFQPTGVYPQIAKNPAIISSSANKNTDETPVWENKSYKIKKRAAECLIIAGAVAIAGFICYYNKGIKAINLKKQVVPKLPEKKTFEQFVKECAYTYEEKAFVEKAYKEGLKFENNIVGKIHNGLNSISNFFRTNFYGYKETK